jgi:hypothetical protein
VPGGVDDPPRLVSVGVVVEELPELPEIPKPTAAARIAPVMTTGNHRRNVSAFALRPCGRCGEVRLGFDWPAGRRVFTGISGGMRTPKI